MIQRRFLEQGHVENLQDCVETELAVEPFPDDGHENVDGDRDPDLALHGVLRGAEEGLDPKVLLDPFEKKFDLPPGLAGLGDRHRRQVEVVGEEHQFLAVPGIAKLDPAQLAGIVPVSATVWSQRSPVDLSTGREIWRRNRKLDLARVTKNAAAWSSRWNLLKSTQARSMS